MKAIEIGAVHSTFVIERSFPVAPERVYAAFSDPVRKKRWYAEGDHEIKEFEMDFRVGGRDKLRYQFGEGHRLAGSLITNETVYQDIEPDKRIIMTTRMSLNGKPIEVVLTTFEFAAAGTETKLVFTHQGTFIDWPDGPAMIEKGWQALIDKLAQELTN